MLNIIPAKGKNRLERTDRFATFNCANRENILRLLCLHQSQSGQRHQSNACIVKPEQVYNCHCIHGWTRFLIHCIMDQRVGVAIANAQVPHDKCSSLFRRNGSTVLGMCTQNEPRTLFHLNVIPATNAYSCFPVICSRWEWLGKAVADLQEPAL